MKLKFLIFVCIALCTFGSVANSAITGEIEGVVTNAETGEPLIGVSVQIQGTTMGAKTNADGEFFILNIPVGTYVLVYSSVGYGTLKVENLRISADYTTRENRQLTPTVTEAGTITVKAERPLVNPEKTTTVNIVTAGELSALPVRGFEQAVNLQNSVVRMLINNDTNVRVRGQRESNPTAGELNLRGGRPSEVAYYVDGFSQQDPLTGLSTSNIANNAIEEVQVTSGAFSAEYGHVASGIVNVVTKSGTNKYHGTLDLVTDNIFGDSYDQNYYSLDFGGPVPGWNRAKFFVSGERRWLGDRSPSVKTEEFFTEARLDTNSVLDLEHMNRLPGNSLSGWSGQGKLDVDLTSQIKLAFTGTASVDKWQEYQHNWLFDYKHSWRYEDYNMGLNAKIVHNLSESAYYNLSVSYFRTERTRGDGILFDNLDAYRRYDLANPEWHDDLNLFRDWAFETTASALNPSIAEGSDEDTAVVIQSYTNNFLQRRSMYVGVKGDINKQIGLKHTIKAGFDFQRHTLRYYENLNPTLKLTSGDYLTEDVNHYGYGFYGNLTDKLDYTSDAKHPFNLGIYITDRFDWQGLVVNAGLRFDYFDYRALRVKDPVYPLDPGDATGVDSLDRSDLEASKNFTRLSPRLGISFPISAETQFHINYGKFFQRPDLVRLYVNYDFMATRIVNGGSYYPVAVPNLEPEKITQYEFGVTRQLSDNAVLGITVYYKDVQDQTQVTTQIPSYPRQYDYFGNIDYGTVRGIDLNMAIRRSRYIRLDLKYTLSWATGTGSYARSNDNIAWQNPQSPAKSTAPLDYDKRHSLQGVLDFRTEKNEGPKIGNIYPFENISLNIVAQASSGTPYTRLAVYDAVSEGAVQLQPLGKINSTNLPWVYNVDLKLERTVSLGQYNIVPYLWVTNVFNTVNVAAVYEGSGRPDETGWLETDEGRDWINAEEAGSGENREYMYKLKERNPRNYGPPRIIYLGVRMAF